MLQHLRNTASHQSLARIGFRDTDTDPQCVWLIGLALRARREGFGRTLPAGLAICANFVGASRLGGGPLNAGMPLTQDFEPRVRHALARL